VAPPPSDRTPTGSTLMERERKAAQGMVSRMELFGRSGETATCCRSSSRGPGYARRSRSGPVVGLTFRGPANRVLAEAVQAAGDEVGNCSPMRFSVGGARRESRSLKAHA
jgi:hypothetical protein